MEDNRVSKFNAGLLQMERIHELFRSVNLASLHPTTKNVETGMYGYEVAYSALGSLFMEASGKLNKKQIESFKGLRKQIHSFMLNHTIMKKKVNQKGINMGSSITPNWLILENMLFDYQLLVRDLLEKTGLNSPDKGEEALV